MIGELTTRGDAVEGSIEVADVLIEEVGLLHVASSMMRAFWVEEPLEVETIGGNLLGRVSWLPKEMPELGG